MAHKGPADTGGTLASSNKTYKVAEKQNKQIKWRCRGVDCRFNCNSQSVWIADEQSGSPNQRHQAMFPQIGSLEVNQIEWS